MEKRFVCFSVAKKRRKPERPVLLAPEKEKVDPIEVLTPATGKSDGADAHDASGIRPANVCLLVGGGWLKEDESLESSSSLPFSAN